MGNILVSFIFAQEIRIKIYNFLLGQQRAIVMVGICINALEKVSSLLIFTLNMSNQLVFHSFTFDFDSYIFVSRSTN